jgi:hypothetical protein
MELMVAPLCEVLVLVTYNLTAVAGAVENGAAKYRIVYMHT